MLSMTVEGVKVFSILPETSFAENMTPTSSFAGSHDQPSKSHSYPNSFGSEGGLADGPRLKSPHMPPAATYSNGK